MGVFDPYDESELLLLEDEELDDEELDEEERWRRRRFPWRSLELLLEDGELDEELELLEPLELLELDDEGV